jgi:hypothetical protein
MKNDLFLLLILEFYTIFSHKQERVDELWLRLRKIQSPHLQRQTCGQLLVLQCTVLKAGNPNEIELWIMLRLINK